MAVVFSPNVIEIAVLQTHSGRPAVNVWHMWFDRELGTDTMSAVVEDFAANWQDHVMLNQANVVTLQGYEWRSLDPNDSSVGSLGPISGKPTTGNNTGSAMPPNVAQLVHKRTDNRPRGRRDGMSFLAGVVESAVGADGVFDPTIRSAYQTNLNAFYNGISDTSGSASGDRYPCVLETTPASRAPGTASVTINSRRVTSLELDQRCSTQRDRLR